MRSLVRLALLVAVLGSSFAAVAQNVDMTASITDTPDPVTALVDDIVYTAVLTNHTPGVTAAGPTLTITVPASAAIKTMTANNGGTCTGSVPTITCTWAAFSGFAQRTATITITPGSGGTYNTTAYASATNETTTGNNSASTTTTVNATIDLALYSTSDSPNDITLGQGNVTYTISTYNYSSSKATNPVLTVNLPASSTYVSHTVADGGTCTPSGTSLTCNWPVQNSGGWFYTSVTVTPGAGGPNTLTASVAADQGDPLTSNNSKTETTTVNATIDLAVYSTSDSPSTITLGQGNVTYTISTYNYSSSKATNPALTVALPTSSTYVSHTVADGGTCTPSGATLTCNWPVQNSGGWFYTSVTVTPGAGGANILTASVVADQGDHVSSNNSKSETTTVNATIDLAVYSTSDNPTDITLGQGNVTYTVSTYNWSSSKATNPVLTVNLPASSTYVSHTVADDGTCSQAGSVLTCNWPVQNSGGWFYTSVTVTPGAGGTNTLTASVAADQGDHVPSNNSKSENTTVNATLDLAVYSTSDNPNDITLGLGNVTYSIVTYNYSSSKATNPVLSVTLPASSTYVSHTTDNDGTCSPSGGVLTCNWPVQNSNGWFTTTVTVTPGAGGTNTLTASVAADQGDHVATNNSKSENTTVNATIDLAVYSTSDNPNDITLGQGNVVYTIATYNYSTSKASNPVLTVTLPTSSTYVSHTADNGGTCTPSGTVLTCNWPVQNSGGWFTTTVTVTPGAGGTNTLTASIAADQGDPVATNNSRSENTTVNATIDLAVYSTSDNPNDVTLGQGNVVYTINTYNYTSSKATNPVLTINLPASSTYVSHTADNGGTCTPSGGTLTCNWAVQNSGGYFTTTVTVTPGAGGTNTLAASVAADQGDHVPANNTRSENTTVNATIDLAVYSTSDNPTDITLGQGNVVYTIATYNYSTSKATNPVLTLTLPTSSTYVSHTVDNSGTCTPSGGTVSCTWAAQNSGGYFTTTVTVTPGVGGTNTLGASVAATQGDPVTSNNSKSENTTVNTTLDLQLSLSDSPDPRVLGAGVVTYSMQTYNATSSKATNFVFTLTLPGTVTYNSATPSAGGTCSQGSSVVTCSWPDIAGFNYRTASIVVTPTAAGQISATGSVTATQGDPNTANNTVTTTTNINPGSAPTITSFTPASGPAGTSVTITGSNFFSSTSVKFNTSNSTFTVNSNGSITATVPAGATSGPITVTNSVGPTTSSGNFTVTAKPDLTVAKTASAVTVPTGSPVTYTITVNNTGNGATHDVTVVDTLPAGVTVTTAANGTGWTCSGTTTITCTMGPLAATTTAPAITIGINAPSSGTTITNTVAVSTTTPEVSTSNNSGSVSVSVVGCPTTPPITAPVTVCKNSAGHSANTPPVPSATNYIWTVTNGTLTGGQGTNAITFDAGASGPISVSVDVYVTSCPTASNSVNVNVSAPAATITASGPTTFCSGDSVTLTANNGSSWLWSTGASSQSIVVSTNESITVQVTDAAGCTATSSPTIVTVNPPAPTPTISTSGSTSFCAGGSVTLISSESTGNQWKLDGNPISGATGQNFVATSAGNYSVVHTNGSGCSAESAVTAVAVTTPPPAPTISADGPLTFCDGEDVVLSAPAATGYLWSNGATTQSITVTASGTFTVQVKDAANCFSPASAPVTVNVNPAPAALTISAGGPTTFCAGGSVVLTAGNADGWLWSNGATSQSITVTASGTFTVQAISGGCPSSASPAVTVSVNPVPATPVITADGPTTFCAGGSVTLSAPAANGYLWSNGATSQSITVSASGSFTVQVSAANGCQSPASAPVTVTVNPAPVATITPSGPTTFCTGGSVTLTASNGDAWLWSDGSTSQSVTVNATSTLSVQVTTGGCTTQSAPVTVSVEPTPPTPVITASGPTSFCAGGSVTLSAPASAGYLWSNGATSQSITVTASGTFTVQVSGANGCQSAASAPATVNVGPAPVATITASGPTTFCAGGSVTLTASSGDSWLWSNGSTANSITVTAPGTFSVQVTTAGCSTQSSPVTVNVNSAPAVVIAGPTANCGGTPITLDAGGGFATYAWSNGATTQQITVSPTATATFSVVVTDGSGCSASDTHTVTVTATPTTSISAPANVCESSAGNAASVPAQPGATYAWSITNGTITSATNSNAITFTAGGSGQVTLDVNVTNGGCVTPGSRTIPIVPYPTVTITGPTTACSSDNLTLSVPGTFATYLWSNGSTSPTITVNQNAATQTYTVTVTNAAGCSATDTHTVTLSSDPDATVDAPAEAPASSSQNASVPLQAGATYVWTLSNGTITAGQGTNAITFETGEGGTTDVSVQVTVGTCTSAGSASVAIAGATPPPCPTATIVLIAPAEGANASSPVTLQWQSTAGSTSYDVYVDGTLRGTVATTTMALPLTAGAHTWRVVGHAGTCEFHSTTRTFTVLESSTCSANGRSQITAPAPGATASSPVTFSWTNVPGAIGYRLLVQVNGAAAEEIGATNGTTTLTASVPPGAISAVVETLFNGCPATRSDALVFNILASDPCLTRATATLVAPANNATVNSSSVFFDWNAASGASGYRVWVSVDGAPAEVLGTTAETSFAAVIGRGRVSWWIESLYDGCASTESQPRVFTIPAAESCGTARPMLVTPVDGSTTSNGTVTFTWSGVPGALGYEVYLALNGGTPSLIGETAGATTLTATVPAGELTWFVRVLIDRCPARDSQIAAFTYQQPVSCASNQRAVLIEPVADATSTSPVTFDWNDVAGASGYQLFVIRGASAPQLVSSTGASTAAGVQLAPGQVRWFVRTLFAGNCPALDSPERELQIVATPAACSPLDPPVISAPAQISAGTALRIQWSPVAGATGYQLQMAGNSDFTGAQTVDTNATQHPVTPTGTLYARVRAIDSRCPSINVSAFSPLAAIFVLPAGSAEGSAPLSDPAPITFSFVLGPQYAGQTFNATPRQPWLTVTPSAGVVAAGGTTLTVVANTNGLPVGTSIGGLTVTLSAPAGRGLATNDTVVITPNFSVGMVTPVTPSPRDTPPPDALIIPAVAHADGINSHFQSDVRVSNTSARLINYQVTFTPSGDGGFAQGQQSQFSIEPGRTIALDDVLKSWFGTGGGSAMGTLEIRPLTEVEAVEEAFGFLRNLTTFASSRTFNITSAGTFGQYIPAVPFANFVGRDRLLSLQQIAQSSRYRTNLGLVEGSGRPASLIVRVFGSSGQYLTEFNVDLRGGQHLQLNSFLRDQGVGSLDDGRVEIEVASGEGLVTAYASVLDNETSDPLLVTPVAIDSVGTTKWVIPGVADLASGFANWQTDMRLFNAGSQPVETTFSFYSQGGGEAKVKTLTIGPGEVRQFDKALVSLFGTTNDAGAVHITTTDPSRLVATARTFNQAGTGTYGQFISAVTVPEAAGAGSRPLQLLQVEESARFRSNIGLVEVSGKPVRIEISAVPPDAKFTAVTELELQPNEFRQLGSLLKSMGLDDTHNARVTVQVLDGEGRVTAYASVIDMLTNDPTYVPAQ